MPYRTPGEQKVIRRYEPTPEEVTEAIRTWLMEAKEIPISYATHLRFTWVMGNGKALTAPPRPTITWDDDQ